MNGQPGKMLQPIIKIGRNALNTLNKPHSGGVSYKEREYFTENLALLLKAAVPVGDAFESLRASSKSAAMKAAVDRMRVDVEAGYSLSKALERSGITSGQTLALVQMGEQSGHLVENLQLAAKQEEKRHVFRSKVQSALLYPTFVLGLTGVIGLSVAWFLLPRLAQTFDQLHVKLPLISRILIGVGVFLKSYGFIAVPLFIVLLGVVGYILFVRPKTRHIGRKMLFKVPGVSRLLYEVEVAQFGYLLGTLLDAGLPVTQAISLLADSSTSPHHQEFYNHLGRSLDNGFSFKESMTSYKDSGKLIPPAVQQMIIAGEHSGSLSEVLSTIGRTYEEKSDVTTQNLEAILEPVLLIIVWLGVMGVAVAVIMPIYSLVGGLDQ